MKEHNFLIIGGVPKAGTTSLYTWLKAHPQVCASSLKETRFFLDKEHSLVSARRFNGDNLDEYESFFSNNDKGILRVEATPDYLYSKTAANIVNILPNSKIVFILRDPIERLVSWYKYSKQRGFISTNVSFEEYIEKMVEQTFSPELPIHLHALEQCRYEKYLLNFRETFGERMMVINFSDLKSNSLDVVKKVCEFSGLNGEFYNSFKFQAENVSHAVKFPRLRRFYAVTKRKIRYSLYNHQRIARFLKGNKEKIKSMFEQKKKVEEVIVSEKIKCLIRDSLSI